LKFTFLSTLLNFQSLTTKNDFFQWEWRCLLSRWNVSCLDHSLRFVLLCEIVLQTGNNKLFQCRITAFFNHAEVADFTMSVRTPKLRKCFPSEKPERQDNTNGLGERNLEKKIIAKNCAVGHTVTTE